MEPSLDFEECIKDSPEFRSTSDQFEADVSSSQTQSDKVMKSCGRMVEAGQAYNAANQSFSGGSAESSQQQKETEMMGCSNQFQQGSQEMSSFHTMSSDQTQRAIIQQSGSLCSRFLPQSADTRKEFSRIGEDSEAAAAKSGQASRHRAADAERASHSSSATRKCYQHFASDYCSQSNAFKTQQKVDVSNSVFSYVHAQFTFFHQGFDSLRDSEPGMKTSGAQSSQLSSDCSAKRKESENRHSSVQQRDASGEPVVSSRPDSGDIIQGYSFKRSRRKTKTWKRCWFSIRDNQLIYRKSHKEDAAVSFEDSRSCAVKPMENTDRRFCFESSSVQKCCASQADTEQSKQAWLSASQGSIDSAYRERSDAQTTQPRDPPPPAPPGGDSSPGPPSQRPAVSGVALRGPGNRRCCDCGEEDPRWASVNSGVTVCIECSGIHRSLGVHSSKVRSSTSDSWDAEQSKSSCVSGNDAVNRIYEARCSEEGRVKPRTDSPRSEKEAWIREKYVEKRFVKRSAAGGAQPQKGAGLRLYQASVGGDLVAMATASAEGAEVNSSVGEEEGRTASIGAAVGGSSLACEFSSQNGANVNHRDQRGRGASHAAATAGHTGQVCSSSKRGANQYAVDENGQDPSAIAVETANADIVTSSRMARMNEEMRDSEGVFSTTGDDETFQDIFRDFSEMASNDPEKLSRRQFDRDDDEGGGDRNSSHAVDQTTD